MALPANIDEIASKVQGELEHTPYACSSLQALSGGTGNFIYRATLQAPLPDGTPEVLVKHGEGYVALNQNFQLPTTRCRFEEICLEATARLPPTGNARCTVKTPKVFYFDPATNTQVQEFAPNSANLKNYAISHLAAPTPSSLQPCCLGLGMGLGSWLRGFHEWARRPEQKGLRDEIKKNGHMKAMKIMINYSWLLQRVDEFPSVLADAKDVFTKVKEMGEKEAQDEDNLQVIHGDFWTGNVLLPDTPLKDTDITPLTIIDWELAQLGVRALDLGQMIAELYELYLYKDIAAGVWFIKGFVDGYGGMDDDLAFRVLVQVGVHLISFGTVPGWGTPEQVEKVLHAGKEIIVKAWAKDRSWFQDHPLGCILENK